MTFGVRRRDKSIQMITRPDSASGLLALMSRSARGHGDPRGQKNSGMRSRYVD